MATGAAGGDGLFRGVFEGSIGMNDTGIQRRPYHRNCSCALHKSRGHCTHSSRHSNISYPIRRTWSEGCLSLMAASSGHSSPCSSPVATAEVARMPTFLASGGEQEADVSCKV